MKKQLLLLPVAIAALFATAQTEPTDLSLHNLKGKVKSVNEIVYDGAEKFGELEKGAKTSHTYREFNSAGYELQFLNEHFEDGEKDKFVRTTRYENNKAVEMKEDDNGDIELTRMKYNPQGLLESIDGLDGRNNLHFRQKNKYNAEGLLVQSDSYKADGSLEMKSVKTYDAKKQLAKEEVYNGEGKLTKLYTYAYDSRGNKVEDNSTDYERKQVKPWIRTYSYNEKGQKTEERNSIAGLDKKEVYEYNAQGDETKHVDEYGGVVKKVYTYDASNNWIRCVVTKEERGKTTHEIRERQIKY